MNRSPTERDCAPARRHAVLLIAGGGILLAGSVAHLVHFVSRMDPHMRMTPGAVMRLLVLPHVLMLTGAGILLTGMLIAMRHNIERTRQ